MQLKTRELIHRAWRILERHNPMTLRQVFYRLVAAQVIENKQSKYKALGRALVIARQEGTIPWDWIEDRLRKPRPVPMWSDLSAFSETALNWYRRDVWDDQPHYIEVWLEKDALSGIFQRTLYPYGVTLNVGRGYDSWSSIYTAAGRYGDGEGVTILYFGDFDPSGEDMIRSLSKRLRFFHCRPEIDKVAVTWNQIKVYDLPPNPAKLTDTRTDAFVALHGDNCVELDALPPDVLEDIIKSYIATSMDLDTLAETKAAEEVDLEKLEGFLKEA